MQTIAERLKESGLTEKDGAKLKMRPANATKLGFPVKGEGVVIPYFTPEGEELSFFRFRYLTDTRSQWDKVSGAKGLRYTQPAGTGLEVYLPPVGAGENWAETLSDPKQPILITEGEFKAACACKNGFACIGLGGVWSFAVDDVPLPVLKNAEWEGRKVFIVYDSDAVNKPQVNQAEARLARLLGEWGAVPHIVRLPE